MLEIAFEGNHFQNFLGEHAPRPHRKGGVMWELLVDTVGRSPSNGAFLQALAVNPFLGRFIIRTVARGDYTCRQWEEPVTTM